MRIFLPRLAVVVTTASIAISATLSGRALAQQVTTQDVQVVQQTTNPNLQTYTVEIESVEIDGSAGQEAPIVFTTTLKVPPGSTPPDLPQGGAVSSNTPLLISNTKDDPRLMMPARYGSYGPQGESFARCGGATNGKLDEPCQDTPSEFVTQANFAKCPEGAFFDLFTKSCYDCPQGYTRSAYGVTSDKACWKRNRAVNSQYSPAKMIRSVCPAGSFSDPKRGGECWSCPAGYFRGIAPVGSELACVKWRHQDVEPAQQTQEGDATELRCKVGEFLDAELGGCFACPTGYSFTGAPRDTPLACAKTQPTQRSPATLVGVAKCEPGEFLSPRNLGECWACPPNMQRSGLPLTGQKACQSIGGFSFQAAEYIDSRVCPAGTKHSPWGIGYKPIRERIRKQTGQFPPNPRDQDYKLPGTCWTCPTGYKRKAGTMVWSDQACQSIGIGWSPAPYVQPGLFGLDGGEEVAKDIIRNRPADINAIAAGLSGPLGMTPGESQREAWDEIAGAPHDSIPLQIAAWSRVVLAAEDPAGATPAEKKLLESFQTATQHYKTHLAQTALELGREWQDVERAETARAYAPDAANAGGAYGGGGNIYKLYDNPPDFDQLSAEVVAGTFVGGAAAWTVGMALLANAADNSAEDLILPFRGKGDPAIRQLKRKIKNEVVGELMAEHNLKKIRFTPGGMVADENLRQAIQGRVDQRLDLAKQGAAEAGEDIGKKFAKTFGRKLASSFSKISAWVSLPFVEIMLEVVVNAIEQAVKKANVVPKLEAKLAQAQQPVDLARWLNTSAGVREAMGHWTTAISGTTPPGSADQIASLAKAELAKVVDTPAQAQSDTFTLVSARDSNIDANCATRRDATVVPGSCTREPTLWRSENFRLLPQPQGNAPVCVVVSGEDLVLKRCDPSKPPTPEEMWSFAGGHIKNARNQCWQHRASNIGVLPCAPANVTQRWDAKVR